MTIGYTAPDHLLRLDEWDALPVDSSRRVELVEGVLLVSPRPMIRHQDVVAHLVAGLRAALSPGWRALVDVEVVIDPGSVPTVRVPDVVVLPASSVDTRTRCPASEVRAVFEVLSPGTVRTDRVTKLSEYADAGIPLYGIVDPGPPVVLTEFRLVAGVYERAAAHAGRASLELDGIVQLDLAE